MALMWNADVELKTYADSHCDGFTVEFQTASTELEGQTASRRCDGKRRPETKHANMRLANWIQPWRV